MVEPAHWYVMSIDLVEYSDLPGADQVAAIERLVRVVQEILAENSSLRPGFFLATGDGMIVGFNGRPLKPLELAMAIHARYGMDRSTLRIGIHAGLAFKVKDINNRVNYAGAGINYAQRVESCCVPGQILVNYSSSDVRDLGDEWQKCFTGPFGFRVKRGKEFTVFNFCDGSGGRFGCAAEPTVDRDSDAAVQLRPAMDCMPVVAPTILAKSAWRCGIYEYPPLSSWPTERDANPDGPLVVLATHVAAALGKRAVFEKFSYKEFYESARNLPDLVMGMFATRKRWKVISFSRPIYGIGLQGICLRSLDGDPRVGLRRGSIRAAVYYGEVGWEYAQREFSDACKEERILEIRHGRQLDTMSQLLGSDLHVVLMDHVACHNFLDNPKNRRRFRLAFNEPIKTYSACVAVRSDSDQCLSEIDEAIVAVRNSTEFLRLEDSALVGYEPDVVERLSIR